MLDRDTLAKIVADCVWVVLAPHDDKSIGEADWLELAKQIGQDSAEAIIKATEHETHTVNSLTVDAVRYWYQRHGAMYPIEVALHASPELRSDLRETLPHYPEPAVEQQRAARQVICDALNAGGQS